MHQPSSKTSIGWISNLLVTVTKENKPEKQEKPKNRFTYRKNVAIKREKGYQKPRNKEKDRF